MFFFFIRVDLLDKNDIFLADVIVNGASNLHKRPLSPVQKVAIMERFTCNVDGKLMTSHTITWNASHK